MASTSAADVPLQGIPSSLHRRKISFRLSAASSSAVYTLPLTAYPAPSVASKTASSSAACGTSSSASCECSSASFAGVSSASCAGDSSTAGTSAFRALRPRRLGATWGFSSTATAAAAFLDFRRLVAVFLVDTSTAGAGSSTSAGSSTASSGAEAASSRSTAARASTRVAFVPLHGMSCLRQSANSCFRFNPSSSFRSYSSCGPSPSSMLATEPSVSSSSAWSVGPTSSTTDTS
mmetsp:Transcript_13290/g.37786  ORF Transcript_13290/g.37786 Transcript_13290/m.37786 type:complete len:234 (-) Transcript_13290:1519-2220(-)